MMIEKLIDSIKAKHKEELIPEEAYAAWRQSTVTKRLMEELEVGLMELAITSSPNLTLQEAGMMHSSREGFNTMVENVICWKPQELLSDED